MNKTLSILMPVYNGRLAVDNNVLERTIKEFVLGQKNYLLFGSPDVAKYSVIIMSVLSSARRHGLNEWEYLVDVLYRRSDWNPKRDSLQNLLPDRWAKSPTEAASIRLMYAIVFRRLTCDTKKLCVKKSVERSKIM